jgi:hypothetical protein
MTKLKLKMLKTELEYEVNEKFIKTEILPLLEEAKKNHNLEVKRTLLKILEGLQQNLTDLESYSASMSQLNGELDRRMKEFSKKSASFLEDIKTHADNPANILQTTKDFQEMQMSFSIQYLQLQQKMQNENRSFTLISNIMKTKHDTAKNSINNIR